MTDVDVRYCPRCGTPLERRPIDGRLRPACPACPHVHFGGPVAVAGTIVLKDREVLLVRMPGAAALPVLVSGYLEAFESFEEAAVREVREETGLEVRVEQLLGSYPCGILGKNMVFGVCVTRVVGGTLRPGDEIEEASWHSLDALPAWPSEWPVARAFADLRRRRAASGER